MKTQLCTALVLLSFLSISSQAAEDDSNPLGAGGMPQSTFNLSPRGKTKVGHRG